MTKTRAKLPEQGDAMHDENGNLRGFPDSRIPDTTMDLEAIRARCNQAKGMAWGNYNVYPYLDDLSAVLSRLEAREREIEEMRIAHANTETEKALAIGRAEHAEKQLRVVSGYGTLEDLRSQNAEMMRVVEAAESWFVNVEDAGENDRLASVVKEYRARASRPTETAPTQEPK